MYPMMKHSHLLFVVLTVFLFNLRFLLRWVWPEKNLPKLLKIMPHLNDTLLLGTGLWFRNDYHEIGAAQWQKYYCLYCVNVMCGGHGLFGVV